MPPTRHAGRPLNIPSTEPGAFIARRLLEIGLSPETLAARLGVTRSTVWRLLQGKTTYSVSIPLRALCDALELTGAPRERLVRLYLREDVTSTAALSGAHAKSLGLSAPDVDDTASPAQQLRAFLQRHIAAAHLTQTKFAARIGVEPSTVTRLLAGGSGRTYRIQPDRVIGALGLDEVSRRTFLWLAFQAGWFALTPQAARPVGPLVRLERLLGMPLDAVEEHVERIATRRNRGEVASAYTQARALFSRLYDDAPPTSVGYASPQLARARLRVGFEYCQAQAATLAWYDRGPHMIQTLDRMQAEVIQYFPPSVFASELGHLVNLRAPLYRDLRGAHPPETEYQRSIAELTDGIEHSISPRAEPTLHVELLRNRAHTRLYAGDVRGWRRDLEMADRVASTLRGDEGDQFRALVTYSWGEGYALLAGEACAATDARRYHAREAIACLDAGKQVFQGFPLWQGYALLARVARAKCLGWTSPDEALGTLRQLQQEAAQLYPAMTAKIARVARALTMGLQRG